MNAFIFVHLFKFCKVIVLVKIKKDFFFKFNFNLHFQKIHQFISIH